MCSCQTPQTVEDGMVLAKPSTERLFCASMNKLKANKEASWKGLNVMSHRFWANHADRGNMTWHQSTSKISETVSNMLGAETRAKPVMLMLRDIVLKTANRMTTAASASGDDSFVVPKLHGRMDERFCLLLMLMISRRSPYFRLW